MQTVFAASHPEAPDRIQWDTDGGIRLDLVGLVDFPNAHQGALHSHPFWELIFIGDGNGRFHHEDKIQSCGTNDIHLVQPGVRHQFKAAASDHLEQFYIGFSFDFPLNENQTDALPFLLPASPFSDRIKSDLRLALNQLKQSGETQAIGPIRGRLLHVISSVIGFLTANQPGRENLAVIPSESLLNLAKDYLQANLRLPLTVPELARHFCLSPKYFGEIFKSQTGLTIKEYQRNIRLERAMELLRESTMSITKIAEAVGLEDQAYFSRIFKNRFHIPPRQFRKHPFLESQT